MMEINSNFLIYERIYLHFNVCAISMDIYRQSIKNFKDEYTNGELLFAIKFEFFISNKIICYMPCHLCFVNI